MVQQLFAADYIVFAASLIVCIIVGFYFIWHERRKVQKAATSGVKEATGTSAGEYFLGRRHLPLIPTIISLFASNFSAIGMLGVPAEVYTFGTVAMVSCFGYIAAGIIAAFIYIPIYFRNQFSTCFEYVEKRFESKILRLITTTFSAAMALAYAAVCAYVPCEALEKATGIPSWILVIGTGIVTIFYTTTGGIRAVLLVDTIQAAVMFVGIIAVLVAGMLAAGGIENVFKFTNDSGYIGINDWRFDPLISHTFWSILIGWSVNFTTAIANNQSTLQRCCSLGSQVKASGSMLATVPLVLLLYIIYWLTTLAAITYYNSVVQCDPLSSKQISSPNQIIVFFIMDAMNYPGFAGLYFAALFSGSLSSMSTAFNSVSSMIWEDVLKESMEHRLSNRQIVLLIKTLAAVIGMLTCLLGLGAKFVGGSAIKVFASFTGSFGGTIHAVYIAAAFLPFVTSTSLIISTILSLPIVLVVIFGQIICKTSHYDRIPSVTTGCYNVTTSNFSEYSSTVSQTLLMPSTTTAISKSVGGFCDVPVFKDIFRLSYNYFSTFSILLCLGIAIIISLISIPLKKCFPTIRWLHAPKYLNPLHFAIPSLYKERRCPTETSDVADAEKDRPANKNLLSTDIDESDDEKL